MATTNTSIAQRAADNIRILAAAMVEKAASGHPGGAMGAADFIHILFSEYLNCDPEDASYRFRDRFFLDPGHMSPMLYAQLALMGFYSMEDLKNFRQWGSPTPGHPELDVARGVENTSTIGPRSYFWRWRSNRRTLFGGSFWRSSGTQNLPFYF